MGSSTHEAEVCIDRAVTEYVIPRDHPAPERLRTRLDDVLNQNVISTLQNGLAPWFAQHGEDVWFVRQLACEADLDADHDPDVLARRWSTQIVRALVRTIERGAASDGVLHFPNRAAYLAQFLVDLAKGQAWQAWYYREFQGLKMLPVEAAIRTAVLDHVPTGLASLLTLEKSNRLRVLKALTPLEARRVLNTLATQDVRDNRQSSHALIPTLIPFLGQETVLGGNTDQPWLEALSLYLTVIAHHPRYAGKRLQSVAIAIVTLEKELIGADSSKFYGLLRSIRESNPAGLYSIMGTQKGERVLELLQSSQEERDTLTRELETGHLKRRGATRGSKTTSDTDGESRFTSFGGIFVLLPLVDRLPLEEAVKEWEEFEEVGENVHILRLLILVKCIGQSRDGQAFHDPVIRDLFHIPPTFSLVKTQEWIKRIKSRQWIILLKELVNFRLQEWKSATNLTIGSYQGKRMAVLTESRRGLWLGAKAFKERTSLHTFLTAIAPEESSSSFLHEQQQVQTEDPQRFNAIKRDLMFLKGSRTRGKQTFADLCLSVMAQSVLRDFAFRLPGFSNSSLEYLAANFFDMSAKVEEDAHRRVVTLSHPPLDVILNMTGMVRAQYSLSWLPDLTFELFPET